MFSFAWYPEDDGDGDGRDEGDPEGPEQGEVPGHMDGVCPVWQTPKKPIGAVWLK